MARSKKSWQLLGVWGLVVILYLLLVGGYSVVTPLFETPDEHHHYFMARYIADWGRLPVIGQDEGLARQEAAQPPFYYWIAAQIIGLVPREADWQPWFNPFVALGDAGSPVNINAFIHTPAEAWPWQGDILAIHLVRLLSGLFGLGTLVSIALAAGVLWPQRPFLAPLAASLVAFLPQFLFLHGSVSNDAAIIFFCSLALWQLLRLWSHEMTFVAVFGLGFTVGLAILSKMGGLVLLGVVGGTLCGLAWYHGYVRRLLPLLVVFALPVLVLAAPLLWRNWQLYGDVTAANQFVALAGGNRHYTLSQVWSDMDRVWYSFFAFLGWMNVRPPEWVYAIWHGLLLIAGWGVVKGCGQVKQPWRDGRVGLLFIWFLLIMAAWVRFMMQTPADQGRLLYPAIVSVVLALTYGFSQYQQRWLWLVGPGALLGTAVYCLFVVLPNAYAMPVLMGEEEIPATVHYINASMAEGVELVAVQLDTTAAHPGAWVQTTSYWQLEAPLKEAPVVVYELWGAEQSVVGKLHAYHGQGRYPASLWPVGVVVVDKTFIRLDNEMTVPTRVQLGIKLSGELPVTVGQLKVTPKQWPMLSETAPLAYFENGVNLMRATLSSGVVVPGQVVEASLAWQVQEAPGQDFTTLVHLGDPTQPPLAQADGVARNGSYPTILWSHGEVFTDSYRLVVPDGLKGGRYPVQIGLYDPLTGHRVLLRSDQATDPQTVYKVGEVIVE